MTDYLQVEKDEELITTNDGIDYVKENYRRADIPRVSEITTNTLQSVIDFVDCCFHDDLVIQIEDQRTIKVFSELDDMTLKRELYLVAKADVANVVYGRNMDLEKFNLMIQACFENNDDKKAVLAYTSVVEDVNSRTLNDDGITQKVTVKTGVTTKGEAILPNPVTLKPYRTFTEIPQPESQFIFRMCDGPTAMLVEVESPKWKIETIKDIRDYLLSNLESKVVILA